MIIKKSVIAGFNRGAKTYHQAADLQAEIANKLAEKIPAEPAQRILEIGCGTGLFSQHLVQSFPEANLYLTDIAEAMVKQCKTRFDQHGQIQFLCLDGEALPELPAFDLIASSMTLHWFENLTVNLQNITQKLNHNGRFIFSMLTAKSLQEWRSLCETLQVPFATPLFPVSENLQATFPNIRWQIEEVQVHYKNLHHFLSTLKLLGAIAPRAGADRLSLQQLRRMMRRFQTPMMMTYEVAYGEFRAS